MIKSLKELAHEAVNTDITPFIPTMNDIWIAEAAIIGLIGVAVVLLLARDRWRRRR